MTESEKILHEFLETFKPACKDMSGVYKYLRLRDGCPAAKKFKRASERIDEALEIALNKFRRLKDEK